ncbi:class I SAM-dependent methyltransferase [Sedimenticola hydrogenitrophicus]|uniref:class I SAM-dependent methyltransferase n=1 Tax=Sedimenticola hydrogenitrophicus TaxID=2967975 RepID=UPI0021A72840|nr:methyltransferase domain-containing protein [Sedimenticola hydrogenitrophicus]
MYAINCPVCKSAELYEAYPKYAGPCITSDSEILPQATIENRICRGCGLIFNAGGTRGATEAFYRDSYSLMTRSNDAAIQSYQGPEAKSQAERTLDFMLKFRQLPESGSVLEAGAGKGEFLGHFIRHFPRWKISAFEPSRSYEYLVQANPEIAARRCGYHEYEVGENRVDLVVSLGVLEHVDNPFDMLVWANRQLTDDGYFYLRVPNFSNNPNDLFCTDHLSKLTLPTIRALAEAAGFEVIATDESGVPLFALLAKRSARTGKIGQVYDENFAILSHNEMIAQGIVNSVLECRRQANSKGEAFAIFGMASAGLFAPLLGHFEPHEIAAFLDDNRTIWGGTVHGRPIGGPELIAKKGIKHVALSVSPVYFEQIREKLAPLGVSIYTAK